MTVTRSFSPSELRELRKDYTRKDGENVLTWMLRCWDNGADTRELEGGEAKQLGSLSRDSTLDGAIASEPNPTALWTRLLTAMKTRFRNKDDCQCTSRKWNAMERGIQFLRELAVREIICFGPDSQEGVNPDRVECTRSMWRRFSQSAPAPYAKILAGTFVSTGGRQSVNDMTERLREFEENLSDPLGAYVSRVEKLSETTVDCFEKLLREMKALREHTHGSRFVRTNASAIRRKHFQYPERERKRFQSPERERRRSQSPEREHRQATSRGLLWSFLREQGEDMSKWHSKPTGELQERVHELTGQASRKRAAPVYKRDSGAREGTSNSQRVTVEDRD